MDFGIPRKLERRDRVWYAQAPSRGIKTAKGFVDELCMKSVVGVQRLGDSVQ